MKPFRPFDFYFLLLSVDMSIEIATVLMVLIKMSKAPDRHLRKNSEDINGNYRIKIQFI